VGDNPAGLIARRLRGRSQRGLTLRRALILGVVQGPTELLPVSSSAHLSLVPWFAGWRLDGHDPRARKDFEVALHAGTAAALLLGQRRAIVDELHRLDDARALAVGLSALLPAVVGFALERPIERRLGGPRTIAAGLIAGSAAMLLADRRPRERGPADVNAGDGLALGAAQAVALFPGISRTGATMAAARWRRFTRSEANLLSRTVAVPVILGAAVLRAARMRRRGITPAVRSTVAAGAAASFASTLASQGLVSVLDRDRSPWPYAAYRVALAGAVVLKLRRAGTDSARRTG
jgi:undecaprenyl-diphosphatase